MSVVVKRSIVKKLIARDYREAYALRARHFEEAALMTGRDAASTRFKIANLIEQLPLSQGTRVLDVGPGDGALFRSIASEVALCCGVDPSVHAVERLRDLFAQSDNVHFEVGTCESIPLSDCSFDVVVINSVLLMLPSPDAVRRTLRELARVCRDDGLIFVGEVPFRSEGELGPIENLRRVVGDYGLVGSARIAYRTYVRPLLFEGVVLVEPLLRTLHFPAEEFGALCREAGLSCRCVPHRELKRVSTTRNDYLLQELGRSHTQRTAAADGGRRPGPNETRTNRGGLS